MEHCKYATIMLIHLETHIFVSFKFQAFRKRSGKVAPFRSSHLGYSGQSKVAIRASQEPISIDEVRFVSASFHLENTLNCKMFSD